MPSEVVPNIDLRPFYRGGSVGVAAVAAEVAEALRDIGFFVVSNHNVPADLMQSAAAASRRFFDLPFEQKLLVRNTAKGSARGYQPYGETTLGKTLGQETPPDLVERFGFGPDRTPSEVEAASPYYARNVWPAEPAEFRPVLTRYYSALEALTRDLMTVFAHALGVDADFFHEKFEGHNSTLRLVNYPEQATPPVPGQLRAGEHTDYGVVTILMIENVAGGLQVRTRGGTWIDVQAPANSFVVNIGDMLMNWTNDIWLSNLHRVVNPPRDLATGNRRQSLVYFGNPRENVLIECIETCAGPDRPVLHEPVLAGEHRMKKIRAAIDR